MSSNSNPENGFTLLELLVTLSVSALLLTILTNGLIQSRERGKLQNMQQKAMMLSEAKLNERRNAGPAEPVLNGQKKGLNWTIKEREIARDPRQAFALIEVQIETGNSRSPSLVKAQRRFVRAVRE